MAGSAGWTLRLDRGGESREAGAPSPAAGASAPPATGGGPSGGAEARATEAEGGGGQSQETEGAGAGVLETQGGRGGGTYHLRIAARYRNPAECTITVAAKAWSFTFVLLVPLFPHSSADSADSAPGTWVAQMLRSRLDSDHERACSVLQVRFNSAEFNPGHPLSIQGWWAIPSGASADVLRAWLRVEFGASKWDPHRGGPELREKAYDEWVGSAGPGVVTVGVLTAEAAPGAEAPATPAPRAVFPAALSPATPSAVTPTPGRAGLARVRAQDTATVCRGQHLGGLRSIFQEIFQETIISVDIIQALTATVRMRCAGCGQHLRSVIHVQRPRFCLLGALVQHISTNNCMQRPTHWPAAAAAPQGSGDPMGWPVDIPRSKPRARNDGQKQ